jgi:hypothetical protein
LLCGGEVQWCRVLGAEGEGHKELLAIMVVFSPAALETRSWTPSDVRFKSITMVE